MWDLIVSVPDHCLSFYSGYLTARVEVWQNSINFLPLVKNTVFIKIKKSKIRFSA